MPVTTILTIFTIISPILAIIIGFYLGKSNEQKRQVLIIRSEMLKPIDEWLSGVEKMNGMFGDTLISFLDVSPLAKTYSLDERRKAAQFMSEKTNVVLGILTSNSLQTRQTRTNAKKLHETIITLENLIKAQLLPLDMEISEPRNRVLPLGLINKASSLKDQLDLLLQSSYSLTAKIKLGLT